MNMQVFSAQEGFYSNEIKYIYMCVSHWFLHDLSIVCKKVLQKLNVENSGKKTGKGKEKVKVNFGHIPVICINVSYNS